MLKTEKRAVNLFSRVFAPADRAAMAKVGLGKTTIKHKEDFA